MSMDFLLVGLLWRLLHGSILLSSFSPSFLFVFFFPLFAFSWLLFFLRIFLARVYRHYQGCYGEDCMNISNQVDIEVLGGTEFVSLNICEVSFCILLLGTLKQAWIENELGVFPFFLFFFFVFSLERCLSFLTCTLKFVFFFLGKIKLCYYAPVSSLMLLSQFANAYLSCIYRNLPMHICLIYIEIQANHWRVVQWKPMIDPQPCC